MITVTSSAFEENHKIPTEFTGDGEDISPPLSWSNVPHNSAEFALICDDPDAPQPDPWVHWVLYSIPADCFSLEENDVGEAVEGVNSWGKKGYGGPKPPPRHGVHHYYFKIYALDKKLNLGRGASKMELVRAMNGHVLDEGQLIGTYER